MDWFERLTGFPEAGYSATRKRLAVEGLQLVSLANDRRYATGDLELVSLQTLRARALAAGPLPGTLKVGNVTADVRSLHLAPELAGALFQVASQFNLLEMVSPEVTPEHGVTRYQHDRTQGPACAIAAGAATIYRNYFAPVAGEAGQTRDRQLDGLADIGAALAAALDQPMDALWAMRNGYALCTQQGLAAIAGHLRDLGEPARDELRCLLRMGVHRDVEVTDGDGPPYQPVSQAFCSALSVACSALPAPQWQPFAQLVLEAAYEAALLAALLNAHRGASSIVLLTRLGGGAFGNDGRWIGAAMHRALAQVADCALDVRIVNYGAPSPEMIELERVFARPHSMARK